MPRIASSGRDDGAAGSRLGSGFSAIIGSA
jgi:hypothetical protein